MSCRSGDSRAEASALSSARDKSTKTLISLLSPDPCFRRVLVFRQLHKGMLDLQHVAQFPPLLRCNGDAVR